MKEWILLAYEFLSVLCPALLALGAGALWRRRHGQRLSWRHSFYVLIFAVYLFGVFYFTGAGTVFELRRCGLEYGSQQVNLLPFSDPQLDIVGYGLNVLLFLPLGTLLPLLWKPFARCRLTVACGFCLSLLIEISQLCNLRSTDVDDLILNTAGAGIGFFLFRLYARLKKNRASAAEAGIWPAAILIGFVFLFRFFTFDELGAAKLVYGF